MKILCVNAGSSSLKFQVYEMPALTHNIFIISPSIIYILLFLN